MKNKKLFGLDLVRVTAIFLVILVHYFLHNNFYSIEMNGIHMFAALFIRWLAYSCVPLFIILSGYLLKDKEINKKYYKGIFRVIILYVIATMLITVYLYLSKTGNYSLGDYIINFLSFGYYGWYVEMYIGLFLIAPFLNVLFKNLKKSHKELLIIIILMLVSLSPLFNNVKIANVQLNIMNDYWYITYPLLYYFIGSYINEYKIRINSYINLFIMMLVLFLETLTTYFYFNNNYFGYEIFYGYGALPTVIVSVLIFLLLYDKDVKCKVVRFAVSSIAKVSFTMYLLSYIIDKIVYAELVQRYGTATNGLILLKYLVPVVISVFVITYIVSFIVEEIVDYVKYKISKKEGQNEINQLEYKRN